MMIMKKRIVIIVNRPSIKAVDAKIDWNRKLTTHFAFIASVCSVRCGEDKVSDSK